MGMNLIEQSLSRNNLDFLLLFFHHLLVHVVATMSD